MGGQLLDEVYGFDCVQNPDSTYPNPGWHNAPGVIFTDETCPPDVKVGITTSVPDARLHIVEKTTTGDILKLSTSATPDILVVENDGKVGIGVNNPTAHLHVYGVANTGNYIRFENSNGTQFRVDNGGKVFCREVKVTLLSIADYVYDDAYPLMSLKEYENYTKENKHLPGVPSQADVTAQGGVEVGEFQVKLLEKIEELSLYLFKLNEQNEELKKELEDLRKIYEESEKNNSIKK